MICLDAVVQNGYDHPLSGVAFLPCGCHVHIEAILGAAVLCGAKNGGNVEKGDGMKNG